MTAPADRIRSARRALLLGALGLLVMVPATGRSQTARPVETVQPAGALAPATAVVGARVGAQAKKPVAGKVVGVLTDGATGEPLIGGQVGVQGLPLGNVSDETGAYFINNVPIGKQTLTVEYLGYLPQSRELDVQPAGPTTVNFELTPEPIAGEEVVVEETSVADLSDYVERTRVPTLQPAPVTEPEIQHSDTTLMEEWHKSWRNSSQLYSIEYPMMGERVYFRRPPGVPPPSRGTPAGDEVEAVPKAEAEPARAAQPAAASGAKAPAKAGTSSAVPAKVLTASPASGQLAEQPSAPDRALKPATPPQAGR